MSYKETITTMFNKQEVSKALGDTLRSKLEDMKDTIDYSKGIKGDSLVLNQLLTTLIEGTHTEAILEGAIKGLIDGISAGMSTITNAIAEENKTIEEVVEEPTKKVFH